MRVLPTIALCLLLLGCGNQTEPHVVTTEPEYVTVIDLEGRQKVIPLDDFIDKNTGDPAAKSVLAIDRQTGKHAWVAAEKIRDDPPATARYIPIVQSEPSAKTASSPGPLER